MACQSGLALALTIAMFAAAGKKKLSQRKKDRQHERNRLYNNAWKSQVRTYTKRFLAAMAAFDKAPTVENRAKMAEELAKVYEVADKCQVKGVLHRSEGWHLSGPLMGSMGLPFTNFGEAQQKWHGSAGVCLFFPF